jgi:lincosamide nucleotidyltransferase A/C/D/E
MDAPEVVRLLNLFEAARVTVWLDGGWGVDALLEHQVRIHDDLDLIVELTDAPKATAVLEGAGYEVVAGAAPKSFVAVDAAGRQVDVHPVVFDDARGGGVYQMDDGAEWVYPSAGFSGRGSVAGRPIRCLTADVQVLVHDGYELTDKDYRELYLLHKRFGVELPSKYAERALAARDPRPGAAKVGPPATWTRSR